MYSPALSLRQPLPAPYISAPPLPLQSLAKSHPIRAAQPAGGKEELPPGWERVAGPGGRDYFVDWNRAAGQRHPPPPPTRATTVLEKVRGFPATRTWCADIYSTRMFIGRGDSDVHSPRRLGRSFAAATRTATRTSRARRLEADPSRLSESSVRVVCPSHGRERDCGAERAADRGRCVCVWCARASGALYTADSFVCVCVCVCVCGVSDIPWKGLVGRVPERPERP